MSTDSFADKDGNIVEPSKYGMPDWPTEALITLTFAEQAGKTTFTLRHAVGAASEPTRKECEAGWSESLDRLTGYLAEA